MNNKPLELFRRQIDAADENLLNALAKRMKMVEKIGRFKKERGMTFRDNKRWEELIKSRVNTANELKLQEEFIKKLYDLIHEYSLMIERGAK
ncbi:MAG: chorismate mutase [Candidatus Levybacteria bacterium]|nr:chorismate mutase [Candidatus Levybacteria bacterium]MBI2420826.1 chorismate mutase [Candidatus Levybacteria bacterium]